jgi:sterol desaturase/sphingolipid hydroxylase (fatty acid hydroxylase superfamily)
LLRTEEVFALMALFLLLVLVAVVLGIIGTAASGLGYLLAIGVAIFVADMIFFAVRLSLRARRRPVR